MNDQSSRIDKPYWIKTLQQELVEFSRIRTILLHKNPTYPFLYPAIENAEYAMANILAYLEGVNPHLVQFADDYFGNRNISMHREFLRELHTNIEDGLSQIVEQKQFPLLITKEEQAKSIVESIKQKLGDTTIIRTELKKILRLGGMFPTFNDYLNTVIENIPLPETYRHECRMYFDAFSIVRNKMSHSDMTLSESEKEKLITAKFGKIIAPDGKGMQMTFEGYKLLIGDAIRFFDQLNSHMI